MTALVHASSSGGLDRLVLDSPRNRNALSLKLLGELRSGVAHSLESDSRALLLDHCGPVFCSGVDLRERQELGPDGPSHAAILADLLRELWAYSKPILCRVAGRVRGGGMGLVACSDIVVATPESDFAYSEVRVGVAPALVSAVALQKVPLGRLLPWLLTGEAFGAEAAQSMGLVTAVTEEASVEPYAKALLLGGPQALQSTKRVSRQAAGAEVDELLTELEELAARAFTGPEALEGMAAFSARRPAAWVPAA